jgi:hypothetical protein
VPGADCCATVPDRQGTDSGSQILASRMPLRGVTRCGDGSTVWRLDKGVCDGVC